MSQRNPIHRSRRAFVAAASILFLGGANDAGTYSRSLTEAIVERFEHPELQLI